MTDIFKYKIGYCAPPDKDKRVDADRIAQEFTDAVNDGFALGLSAKHPWREVWKLFWEMLKVLFRPKKKHYANLRIISKE